MTPFINGVMLAVGDSPAASIVAKATLTTGLALAGTWLARRSRASVRHAILMAAFGALLALPVVTIVTPSVRIAVLAQDAAADGRTHAAPARAIAVSAQDSVWWLAVSPEGVLFWGWIAGAALYLLPAAFGVWQVRGLRRSGAPWSEGQAIADGLAREAGIRRKVEVLLHEGLPGPMTCGFARPAIVLPADARAWSGEDLNRAIVHELEHVRRGDWLSHCTARAVCAAYWFHPLVWVAWRRLVLEAERSCDDAVLRRSEATEYAEQLVGLAQRLSSSAKSPLPAMANRADLAARIGAVLDGRQKRGRAGAVRVALACAAAAAIVATVSPLKMVAAPQASAHGPLPRLRASTVLVMETVRVRDANGRDIEGIDAGDFVITEDGAPQAVRIYEHRDGPDAYYLLGYYARPSGPEPQFRRIEVVLKGHGGAKLDYRQGYNSHPMAADLFDGAPSGAGGSVDHDLRPPVLIFKREPEYSDEARRAKYQGSVVLQAEVSAAGLLTDLRVIHALGLGLDEKAMEAASQWKFRPGMKNGAAVAVPIQIGVDFRLM